MSEETEEEKRLEEALHEADNIEEEIIEAYSTVCGVWKKIWIHFFKKIYLRKLKKEVEKKIGMRDE